MTANKPLVTTVKQERLTLPPEVCRELKLKAGDRVEWRKISPSRFQVSVATNEDAPGPMAMLGHATRFHKDERCYTDSLLTRLRQGEE